MVRVRGPTPRPQLHRSRTKRAKAPKASDESHVDTGHQDMGDMGAPDAGDDGDSDGQEKGRHHGIIAQRGRRRGVEAIREDMAGSEAEAESGAATARGITRKGMGGGLGDSGFQQKEHTREAYERTMMGNVENDAQRFESLRETGAVDVFNPDSLPRDVEKQGQMSAANHMVRMFDHWLLQGLDRKGCIESAASWLVEFDRSDNVRKVLTELESRPIRDVYPLELLIELVDTEGSKVPEITYGSLLGDCDALNGKKPVYEGHAIFIPVPKDLRIKSFALLDGARPGYEFFPSATRRDCYELLIDTAGVWRFALLGVRTIALGGGKIVKEESAATLDLFTVEVKQMGQKPGAVLSVEKMDVAPSLVDDVNDASDDDAPPAKKLSAAEKIIAETVARRVKQKPSVSTSLNRGQLADRQSASEGAITVPTLSRQISDALREAIHKDPAQRNQAQSYSLDVTFFVPGDYPSEFDRNELFHLAVENAAPFDDVWGEALDAIAKLLAEHEADAKPPTADDLRRSLRRARVQ